MGDDSPLQSSSSADIPLQSSGDDDFPSQSSLQSSSSDDSPLQSSSSDDFAAILEDDLAADTSSDEIPQHQECVNDNEPDDERNKRQKVAEPQNRLEQEDPPSHEPFENSETSISKAKCTHPSGEHPGYYGGMCIACGEKMVDVSGVAFGYINKNLRLAEDEICRLRKTDLNSLLRNKKLCLVLDLDHTLLNSTRLIDLTSEEEYLKGQAHSRQDIFVLDSMHMMTKLRPYVHTFLREASSMFEMYIYTMGEKPYALEMAKLLDPTNVYFNSRVISQADCTQKHQKGLDMVFGQETSAVILDDTEMVWQKHSENLILMEKYHYFSSSYRQHGFNNKSPSELKSDESEPDGALATILAVLKRIHTLFFALELGNDFVGRDVRKILETVRSDILKDCKIVFSHIIPTNSPPENHQLWKIAERLGASCATSLDPSVTHVVSKDNGTDKSRWAVRENKFLVNPGWLEAANYLWRRQPEEKFPVNHAKSS